VVSPPAVAASPTGQPPRPVPRSDPATSGFPDRDQLVQAWGDHVIGRLRPKAKALYQAGRFMGASEGRTEFGLPNEIHRTRCQELRPEVEQALSDHFGCPIGLDLVVDPGAVGHPVIPAGDRADRADPAPAPAGERSEGGGARAARVGPGQKRGARAAAKPSGRPGPEAAPIDEASPVHDDDPDGMDDLSSFDESQLGDVAVVDNSAQSRVLQAFPGAEEVT
jgi:DNA polymerase-3 subunit gamma/tau